MMIFVIIAFLVGCFSFFIIISFIRPKVLFVLMVRDLYV